MIDVERITPDILERLILTSLQNTTTAAALSAAHARGRNNREFADHLAVAAMREVLNRELLVPAEVVIGEGVRDKAPMLYLGEKLGPDDPSLPLLRIAVDPLEGTNLCARGEPGAIAVIAAALDGEGYLMGGIDGYMNKIVLGEDLSPKLFSHSLLDKPIEDIIYWIAAVRSKPSYDIVAMVLERDRNMELIQHLRGINVQIKLIRDGDITAGLLALDPNHDVDLAVGIGAAPEGVITAAMTRVYGGYMEARWWAPPNWDGGKVDTETVLHTEDLARGNVMFSLTAVTGNDFIPGVRYKRDGLAITHTISGRNRTGTINQRQSWHPNPPPPPEEWPVA